MYCCDSIVLGGPGSIHYCISWVRPLDKEKKFISSLPSQSSVLGGLEFCAWYILLVCPNHPRINLSFLGHCLSYDENLDGLSTLLCTPHTQWTPSQWTFSMAEPHKLNRKVQKINWKGQKNEKTSDLGRSTLEYHSVPNIHIFSKKKK